MLRIRPSARSGADGDGQHAGDPAPVAGGPDEAGTAPPEKVVIIGAGFGGFFAARALARTLSGHEARVTMISDVDGLLYQPLLPEVAVGTLDPRTVVVPLSTTLKKVHLVRGLATHVDPAARTVTVQTHSDAERLVGYDRLLITAGSVTRVLDIPGLSEHGIGFKTIGQALYIRDLVLWRMERANDEPDADRRRALLSFVVVGAGYAGTELVAQLARLTSRLTERFPGINNGETRWMLLDMAPKVLPELGDDLGNRAFRVLRRRGVDVRLQTSIERISQSGAHLTDGTFILGAAVIWCAGVTPNPIVGVTGLPTTSAGRLVVDADLRVSGFVDIYAAGDAAAVPDLTRARRPGGKDAICPPTAQHAMRQGRSVARSIVADIRGRPRRAYRHRDLGLVVDLGGKEAVARPIGVSVSGRLAKAITRGYHLAALPTGRRRLRAVTGWLPAGRTPDDVSFGLPMSTSVMASAEHPAATQTPTSSGGDQ